MTTRHSGAEHNELAATVARTLQRHARGARAVAPMRWQVPLSQRGIVTAWLDGDWLNVESDIAAHIEDMDLLRQNATLPGALKFVRRFDRRVTVCGETRIERDTADEDTRTLLADLRSANAGRRAKQVSAAPAASPESATESPATLLAEHIARAGWEPIVRPDHTCVVAINVRGVRHDASLAMGDCVAGDVEVLRHTALAAAPQAAISHLLLLLCGRLRGVKACVVAGDSGEERVVFRARARCCSDAGVSNVLEVLSVACVLFADEVGALAHDVDLARAYLRIVRADTSGRGRMTNSAA